MSSTNAANVWRYEEILQFDTIRRKGIYKVDSSTMSDAVTSKHSNVILTGWIYIFRDILDANINVKQLECMFRILMTEYDNKSLSKNDQWQYNHIVKYESLEKNSFKQFRVNRKNDHVYNRDLNVHLIKWVHIFNQFKYLHWTMPECSLFTKILKAYFTDNLTITNFLEQSD